MNEVFWEYLHVFVLVYIDDILVYSRNEARHRQHVTEVLKKLYEHQLYLKAEKCTFHLSSIQFLGYHQFQMYQNGRKEGGTYQILAHTGTSLQQAFTSAPLLIQPNPEKPFVMEVNASTLGVGAI